MNRMNRLVTVILRFVVVRIIGSVHLSVTGPDKLEVNEMAIKTIH
jgi:hypothetical protein